MKKQYIYVLTSIEFGYKYGNVMRSKDGTFHSYYKRTSKSQREYFTQRDKRTWGWFLDLKTAKKAVTENWGDLFEGNYNHIVIEKSPQGIVTNVPEREYWYWWKGTWEKGGFVPTKKPEQMKGIVGFWS